MKNALPLLITLFTCLSFQILFSQANRPSNYVIVHGAWGGSWAFKEVDSLLTATGSTAYRPSLTGQGERVHLATLDVGLDTHIKDVVNTILYEELNDIILVGHSYGGMVISGVADSIPERIKKLVYLDAFVPEHNESVVSISGDRSAVFEIQNGYVIPPWVKKGAMPPTDVPHPYKTWTDRISLTNPNRLKLKTSYILTVEKGTTPEDDGFAVHASRARKKDWPVLILEADHNAQWSAPKALVAMLKEIEHQ